MYWLDDDTVTDIVPTTMPTYNQSATGYGRKLPMQYKLRIGGRWHRLYAMCFSNVATYYVVKGGQDLILTTATEHRIQDLTEGGRTTDPKEES